MINQTLLNHLHQTGDVYYTRFAAPIGDIYIAGNNISLKAIVFKDSYLGASAINKHLQKGMAESINNAILFLDDYFKKNNTARNSGLIKQTIKREGEVTSLHLEINGISLNLDLAYFTPKEITVYRELLKIQKGATISYGLLADHAGIPGGARFVGNTMAKNAYPIIIPCHRVIKSDGSMGNYSGGVHIKEYLLDIETY